MIWDLIPDTDECSSNPCLNGAKCKDAVNGFSCSCFAGFTGTLCEIQIDECSSDPCLNGGTCEDAVNGFTCSCLDGFTGTTCQISELI